MYYSQRKLKYDVTEILLQILVNMGLSERSDTTRMYMLSDEKFEEYFPEKDYNEIEREGIKEGIR